MKILHDLDCRPSVAVTSGVAVLRLLAAAEEREKQAKAKAEQAAKGQADREAAAALAKAKAEQEAREIKAKAEQAVKEQAEREAAAAVAKAQAEQEAKAFKAKAEQAAKEQAEREAAAALAKAKAEQEATEITSMTLQEIKEQAEMKLYMDALSEYLQSEEWQASIDMFVAENCGTFKSANEFTREHHILWKSYHEIVEMIFDNMALESVGGNVATLEKVLGKVVDRPVKGPRDAATRDVLERLLTYTNFEHFSHMMNRACLQRPEGELAKHRDSLVALGFSPDMVSQLLSERAVSGDGDETFEDLVMALMAMESQPKTDTRSSSNSTSR